MDTDIERGQPLRGIRESRIAIVLLSKNYASSSRKQIVDPRIKTSKRYTVDKQQEWERAFTVLNQLQGYHVRDWDSEADLIVKIADDISFKLNITTSVMFGKMHAVAQSQFQGTDKTLIGHYHGLNGNEKALFRHIACFLNYETYENVMRLLEESELDVGVGLKSLFDKSLIEISEERVISMRHVLQKIGRDIVLGPFIHQPAKRQFLKDTREGCDILIDQSGTENVFGISFRVSEMGETSRRDERFKGMKKLQFMRMYKERLYGKEVRFHLVKGLHSMRLHLKNTVRCNLLLNFKSQSAILSCPV